MTKVVIQSIEEFKLWCSNLQPTFSLDTETTSLKYTELELIGISICDGKQACYFPLTVETRLKALDILQFYINEANIVVMHNSPFDMMVLKKYGVEI